MDAGDGLLLRFECRVVEERIAEKVEVKGETETAGALGAGLCDWAGRRDGDPLVEDEERLLVASGVRPRRALLLGWDAAEPQAECWGRAGREAEDFSAPEAIDEWAEWEGEGKVI